MIINLEMTTFKTMFDYDLEPEFYSFRQLDAHIKAARKEDIIICTKRGASKSTN